MSDPRRRPAKPERIGELLGGAARALGLQEELRRGRQGAAFAAMLEARAPGLAGRCRLVSIERGTMVLEAASPVDAQEARLRGAELSSAFAAWPEGEGSFRVVVRLASPDRRLR